MSLIPSDSEKMLLRKLVQKNANVTDREKSQAPTNEHVLDFLAQRVQASSNCDLQIASISKETPAIVTPEIIHPLPKAASRKKTRKGKRQGKMRILTNTGRE
ncbi:hypothetical protein J6590_065369 [Homalodisca vitripennis]|nr:hypothetical protein J6590_065369 [Homalodisca vitripennis]